MIDAIKKLENTKYQNEHKYTKGVSYNYGLELAIDAIKHNTDYEGILTSIKKTLKLVLTDERFSDECYEGLTDGLTVIKNRINLHEKYMQMVEEEFKYGSDVNYSINNKVHIYTVDMPKKELYDLIDETRNIMESYGFIIESGYNEDLESVELKVIGMVI